MKKVFITGMGAITAAGPDVDSLMKALRENQTCIGPLDLFPTTDTPVQIAGQVHGIPTPDRLDRKDLRRASRSDRLAAVAAAEALTHAGLDHNPPEPSRFGVAIGSSTGGMLETEAYYQAFHAGRPLRSCRPTLLSATVGASADLIASMAGAQGRRLAPSTACSSSALAIAMGKIWIESGTADIVIAGGTDALCRMTFSGFQSLRAMSPEPCRPFDVNRQGLSLGEGAGVVILESESHAEKRGAQPLARVSGAGMSCDAAHPTAPHAESRGAIAALAGALADGDLRAEDIDYINAHGTGTPQNDAAEARAIREILGDADCPVSSTKGVWGHLLGAAGSVEAILSVRAMIDGFLPPQVGLLDPDPDCPLSFVREPVAANLATVVSNSYGFGGNNVSLALSRP